MIHKVNLVSSTPADPKVSSWTFTISTLRLLSTSVAISHILWPSLLTLCGHLSPYFVAISAHILSPSLLIFCGHPSSYIVAIPTHILWPSLLIFCGYFFSYFVAISTHILWPSLFIFCGHPSSYFVAISTHILWPSLLIFCGHLYSYFVAISTHILWTSLIIFCGHLSSFGSHLSSYFVAISAHNMWTTLFIFGGHLFFIGCGHLDYVIGPSLLMFCGYLSSFMAIFAVLVIIASHTRWPPLLLAVAIFVVSATHVLPALTPSTIMYSTISLRLTRHPTRSLEVLPDLTCQASTQQWQLSIYPVPPLLFLLFLFLHKLLRTLTLEAILFLTRSSGTCPSTGSMLCMLYVVL